MFGGRKNDDDWYCKGCNFRIFASKSKCFKCNLDRYGNKVGKNKPTHPGDWRCSGCNFLLFASKKKCYKCNIDRHGNVVLPPEKKESKKEENEDESTENKLCAVCWTQPKNTVIIHENGRDGHQCCCYLCANKLFNSTRKCPLCNQKIKLVVKVY